MKKIVMFLFVSILLLSLVGCTKPTQTTPAIVPTTPTTTNPTLKPVSFQVLKSNEPRVTSPNVSDTDLSTLVSGNSNFAFSLYQTLKKNNAGNMFYSPYSISTALAMTYAGANGDTEKQMSSALHFTLLQAQLHPAFNEQALELASRGQGAKGTDGKSFSLSTAIAAFAAPPQGKVECTVQPVIGGPNNPQLHDTPASVNIPTNNPAIRRDPTDIVPGKVFVPAIGG